LIFKRKLKKKKRRVRAAGPSRDEPGQENN
jgi:hypothetical protein